MTWRKDPWPQKPRWVVIPGSLFPGSLFRCSPGGIEPVDDRPGIGVELDPGKMQAAHARYLAQGYLSAYAQEDPRPMTRSAGPS